MTRLFHGHDVEQLGRRLRVAGSEESSSRATRARRGLGAGRTSVRLSSLFRSLEAELEFLASVGRRGTGIALEVIKMLGPVDSYGSRRFEPHSRFPPAVSFARSIARRCRLISARSSSTEFVGASNCTWASLRSAASSFSSPASRVFERARAASARRAAAACCCLGARASTARSLVGRRASGPTAMDVDRRPTPRPRIPRVRDRSGPAGRGRRGRGSGSRLARVPVT